MPKHGGEGKKDGHGENAMEEERKLKYQGPLEGSKNPWRGKIREKMKAVVNERWNRVLKRELKGNVSVFLLTNLPTTLNFPGIFYT